MDDADSQTLRQSTSWLSAGEGHTDGTAYHSAIRKEHVERKMPIGKQKNYAVEVQGRRAEKEIRNVRLQAVLLGNGMRFDKRKERKEKKQDESQVSLFYLFISRDKHQIYQLRPVLKIRSRRIGLMPTFSRHGRVQASLALLIWLIEKVLPAIETQNVS